MKPAAPTIPIRVESEPSGAQATASTGQSCRAPCEMAVPADANNLTITFSLDKFQPQSIPVQRIELPGDNIDGIEGPRKAGFDPNPVIALLEPAKPPAKRARPLKRTAPATAAPRQSAPRPGRRLALPTAARPLNGISALTCGVLACEALASVCGLSTLE